jgi:hypothetical protein
MGLHGILITLSTKRRAQLEGDPDTLEDVLEARHDTDIPGLLDVGLAWDALDVMLSERGKDALLGDAVLARSGDDLENGDVYEAARVLPPERVAEIAAKLTELGKGHVRERYPSLAGRKIYADLGKAAEDEERDALELLLGRMVTLYQQAAKQKHAMLSLVVKS